MTRRELLLEIDHLAGLTGASYTDTGRAIFTAAVERLLDRLRLTRQPDRDRGYACTKIAVSCLCLVVECLVMEHAALVTVHSTQHRLDHWLDELLELSPAVTT